MVGKVGKRELGYLSGIIISSWGPLSGHWHSIWSRNALYPASSLDTETLEM